MTKGEIYEKIFELNSDEEIMDFIKKRLEELEAREEEVTVGQNYTDSFRNFISQKTHYKAAEKFGDDECPDLVYDDVLPYFNLIKSIRKSNWYNEITLFCTIMVTVDDYLPTDANPYERLSTYFEHIGKRLSIKTIRERQCSFCSERSGLVQNMFKFLGIDSELVCGGRNDEAHAFNLVYPQGYTGGVVVIYDVNHYVNFVNENRKVSFPFFKALLPEDATSLKNGNPVQISDLSKTRDMYLRIYGQGSGLYGLSFEFDAPVYIYGIENAKRYWSSGGR